MKVRDECGQHIPVLPKPLPTHKTVDRFKEVTSLGHMAETLTCTVHLAPEDFHLDPVPFGKD